MCKNLRIVLVVFLGIIFTGCELFIADPSLNGVDPDFDAMNFPVIESIVPDVAIADGGLQLTPPGNGSVIYYNSTGLRTESDIRMYKPTFFYMTAKRYIEVAGVAVPDDSGYKDRGYHTVIFSVNQGSYSRDFTFTVDADGRFRGYIYFEKTGLCDVVSYRMWDNHLYPHATSRSISSVAEGTVTLSFKVEVLEAVPAHLCFLLPSRGVDNGVKTVREYSQKLTEGLSTDLEKIDRIYQFVCFGDSLGSFEYTYYYDIAPGYLTASWIDVFIASQFLEIRKGVCNDFSELFAALARAAGFEVTRVRGFTTAGSGHQWNRVKVDGLWYRVDATYGCGSSEYKVFAEFYPEFDAGYFYQSHELNYTVNKSEEF
ncbi:MAG: transglutaminase domain-containing protein [Spirochaetales bacterium]|nr:transglutaminase domain-containing protein [Spirochaetales bacterium]